MNEGSTQNRQSRLRSIFETLRTTYAQIGAGGGIYTRSRHYVVDMEDDPFMSLALCAEEPSAECATAIAPKPDMEDDPLLKLADQEAKIGSLNESWAKSAPQPAPGVRRKPTVGAIPLSNPSVLPTLSAGFQIKAFRGREPPPPVDKPTSRAYQDLGQGSLIQRHSGLKVRRMQLCAR